MISLKKHIFSARVEKSTNKPEKLKKRPKKIKIRPDYRRYLSQKSGLELRVHIVMR